MYISLQDGLCAMFTLFDLFPHCAVFSGVESAPETIVGVGGELGKSPIDDSLHVPPYQRNCRPANERHDDVNDEP